jgi:hypothetical protein
MARAVKPDSMSSYFRKIFKENPKLLHTRSNDEVLAKYKEMTGQEITERHRQNLSNLKSLLRRKRRKKAKSSGKSPGRPPKADGVSSNRLQQLEEAIDDCMIRARSLDRTALETVIQHLRRARNEVVWKLGEK